MLTPEEIYTKLNLKVNKNDTNGNIKIPKGQFVILFNEQKRKYLDQELRDDKSDSSIENFSDILVLDKPLVKISEDNKKANFELPEDILQRAESYSVASKGDCKDNVIVNWFVKPENINVLLQNSNQKPSFEYQETIAVENGDFISVYKDNFTIDKAYLSYYKDPPDIDIEGYTKSDGTISTNIQTTLSELNIDKILDRTVVEITTNYQNMEQLQAALQRQQLNEQKK